MIRVIGGLPSIHPSIHSFLGKLFYLNCLSQGSLWKRLCSSADHSKIPGPHDSFGGAASKGVLLSTWHVDLVLGGGRKQDCRGPRRLLGKIGRPPAHQNVSEMVPSEGHSQQWPWGPKRCQGWPLGEGYWLQHNCGLYFAFFFFFRAAPTVYRSSQARGRIRAVAASLHHSHSNARSKPHLQPTPQLMATPNP